MKVHIRNWHGVATWYWKAASSEGGDDELCGICRVPFDGTCPNCKFPGDGCPLVLGKGCTHNFHLHCILQWLEQESSRGLCPMCRQTFTPQTVEGVGTDKALEDLRILVSRHQARRDQASTSGEYEVFTEPS